MSVVRALLNHVPRPLLQRAARLAMPLGRIFYAGRTHGCPVCGARLRRFLPYGYIEVRENALCPGCLSLERHRLLWLWLARESDVLRGDKKILHIAPELCLSKKFEKLYAAARAVGEDFANRRSTATRPVASAEAKYITGDLESPLAKVKMDVQEIPFPDETFDTVICNHVLEHVADDLRAMRELYRVTRKGGLGILLSPVDGTRAETMEDDTVTDPSERTRLFGQYDHRRVYGLDYADRLRSAGWRVERIDYFKAFSPAERERFGLRKEILYVVRKNP